MTLLTHTLPLFEAPRVLSLVNFAMVLPPLLLLLLLLCCSVLTAVLCTRCVLKRCCVLLSVQIVLKLLVGVVAIAMGVEETTCTLGASVVNLLYVGMGAGDT